jgi:hypothetical protein
VSAADDAIEYGYENVAVLLDAHWGIVTLEFRVDDARAAFEYGYENVV